MADAAEIIIHDEGDEGEELGEALIEEDATGSKTLALEDLFKEEYKPSKLFEEWSTKKEKIEASGIPFQQQLQEGDSFFDLNYDTTMVIFSFLDTQSLCRIACASTSCRDLADSNEYWLPVFRRTRKVCLVKTKLEETDVNDIDWKRMCSTALNYDSVSQAIEICGANQTIFVTAQTTPYVGANRIEQDDISLIGVSDANGRKPILTVERTETNIVSIYCTGSSSPVIDSCLLKSKGLSGLFVGDDSANHCDAKFLNSEICECKGRAIVILKSVLEMRNCRIHDCYNAVYLAELSELRLIDSEFFHLIGSAIYMSANSSATVAESKVRDCSSCLFLVRNAKARVRNCDFSDFRWSSAEVHENSELEMVNTIVHDSNHENSNGVYALDSAFIAQKCTFTRVSLSGVQTMGGVTHVNECTISDLMTGISSYTRGSIEITKNVITRCKTGIRIGAKTEVEMDRNEITLNSEFGIHVTRLRTDRDLSAEQLRKNNQISINGGDDVQIHMMILDEKELGGVSPEVYLATQEKICTFQYTGSNYHPQKVYRCNTCKLIDNRGMCVVCMEKCHAGHEVEPDDQLVREFFCDCGAEKFCDLLAGQKRQKTTDH